jgi:aldose 1-epimerase
MKNPLLLALCFLLPFSLCAMTTAHADSVKETPFGQTADGKKVVLYTLTNKSGASVSIMNYGATLVKLIVPDKAGKLGDVILGFDTFDPYPAKSPYFGAIVGRYGNRIAAGKFSLDGKDYHLAINNGSNALHGGLKGFDKQIWKVRVVGQTPPTVEFSRLSPDGEEGYPGNLKANVTYTWTDGNELHIHYLASTDKDTVLNLTNHTYFNLAGAGNGTILDHLVMIDADAFTPVDSTLIPTGEIKPVENTPWDFRKPAMIGSRIAQTGGSPVGYDHNYVLNKGGLSKRQLAVVVKEPTTGREMKVYTDQPGVQFYSGNFLDGTLTGKDGKTYPQYAAFCLETQHFPDSPNHPKFPSVVLKPGHDFESTTVYAFSTAK